MESWSSRCVFFIRSIFLLVYFDSILFRFPFDSKQSDKRNVLTIRVWIFAQSKRQATTTDEESLALFSLVFRSVFFHPFLFWFLVCRFSCQLPLLLLPPFLLLHFFSLSFSANTRDGHYNSSSVHATKHRADIKVQCYSLRCSALGWWCWCCCCSCHTVVMLTIHWIIIF